MTDLDEMTHKVRVSHGLNEVRVIEAYRRAKHILKVDKNGLELFYVAIPMSSAMLAELTDEDRRTIETKAVRASMDVITDVFAKRNQTSPQG